jgi:rhodanese-related sulfurtransferase
MKKTVYLLMVAFLMLFSALVEAIDIEAVRKVKIITTDELKKLYYAGSDMVLINSLSPIEFAEERIKDSVNLPYTHIKTGRAKLPEDRNRKLIFYCKGPN